LDLLKINTGISMIFSRKIKEKYWYILMIFAKKIGAKVSVDYLAP